MSNSEYSINSHPEYCAGFNTTLFQNFYVVLFLDYSSYRREVERLV